MRSAYGPYDYPIYHLRPFIRVFQGLQRQQREKIVIDSLNNVNVKPRP